MSRRLSVLVVVGPIPTVPAPSRRSTPTLARRSRPSTMPASPPRSGWRRAPPTLRRAGRSRSSRFVDHGQAITAVVSGRRWTCQLADESGCTSPQQPPPGEIRLGSTGTHAPWVSRRAQGSHHPTRVKLRSRIPWSSRASSTVGSCRSDRAWLVEIANGRTRSSSGLSMGRHSAGSMTCGVSALRGRGGAWAAARTPRRTDAARGSAARTPGSPSKGRTCFAVGTGNCAAVRSAGAVSVDFGLPGPRLSRPAESQPPAKALQIHLG